MDQACHVHGSSGVQLFYLFLKSQQPDYQPLIANTFWGQRLLQGLPSCTFTCILHALSCPNLYMYNLSAHPWVHLNQYGRQIHSFQLHSSLCTCDTLQNQVTFCNIIAALSH